MAPLSIDEIIFTTAESPCVEVIMSRLSLPPKAPAKVSPGVDQHSSDSDRDLWVIEEDSRDSSTGHSKEVLPTKASGSKLSPPRQRAFVAQPALIHLHKGSATPTPTAPEPLTPTAPAPHKPTEPGVGQAPSRARGPPQSRRKAVDGNNRKRGQRKENEDALKKTAAKTTRRERRKGAEGEDIGEGEERVAGEARPTTPPTGPKGEDHLFPSSPGTPRRAEDETRRCPLCDKSFPLGEQLTTHLELHALRYRCLPCERAFGSKSGYYQHQRVHQRGRAFRCAHCPVGFYTKSHLAVHGRLHTGERPFPCPQCPKRFTTASCIKRHMLCHSGVKPHRCPQCGKDFSQNGNLKKHMTTHGLLP